MVLQRERCPWWLVAGVAAMVFIPVAGTAAGGAAPIAEIRITPGSVDWLPVGENRGFTLSVAGPQGFVVWREFAAGELPTLAPVDGRGRTLPDGVYGYELRAVDPGGGEGVLAGYLAVRDGSFVVMPASRPDGPSAAGEGDPLSGEPGAPTSLTTIPDDLVVEGNACIGIDCTASDVFINLTLKSSEPYIFFDDTPAQSTLDHDWQILINDAVGAGEYFAVEDVDSGTVPFRLEAGAPTNSVVLGPAGDLGLGTATPASRLHLFSSAFADAIGGAGPSPTTGPALTFGYGGASFGRGAGFLNARPDASATAPNPSLRFLTANVERMIVTNAGSVGVGTSTPAAPLHLRRTDGTAKLLVEEASTTLDNNRVMLEVVNNGRAQVRMRNTADTSGLSWFISHESTGNFGISREGTGVLEVVVTPTASVGIGTSTPEAPLEVQSTASGLMMQLESGGDVFFREKNGATGQFVDLNLIGNEFRINFGTGGAGPELRLTNTGNLIITGTYTPDYVFEPAYELMPLADLADFVARERHLPNVPNAAEIRENGINVNDFPMRLLEKIEELTLYAIAQQRTIDELQVENARFAEHLAALEEALTRRQAGER